MHEGGGGGDETPKVQRGSPLLRAVHRKQSQSASPVASATPRRHSETPTPGDETLRSGRLSSRKQSLRSLRNENNAADKEVLGLLAMSKNPTRSTCLLVTFILTIGIPTLISFCAVIFGAVLAGIDDTDFENGFWVAASILTTSSIPLGDNTTLPVSDGAKVFCVVCGTWSMGIFGLLVVLLSAPAMDPLFKLLRLR
eukprot:Rhum_TRINITY_DN19392_c0_g1::Rhum_TRINITY_DN19392_c0_g1_i1::g.169741::m.169741